MTTIYKFQIYCSTEQTWKYVWGTDSDIPVSCPTDTSHSVDTSSITIAQKISENEVIVNQPTQGTFMCECVPITIPGGLPGAITEHDVVFDTKILLWTTDFHANSEHVGDDFDVIVGPNTLIGMVAADASIGDTTIQVTTTVTDNVVSGMYIATPDTDLGKVVQVNKISGTITLKNPIGSSIVANTGLLLNVYLGKHICIDAIDTYTFGEKGFQGKIVPAGTTFRMVYTNSTGLPKKVNWRMGYYYGLP